MDISKAIKQKKFRSNHVMMLINLLYTNNWIRDNQNDLFAAYDIKVQHFNILRILKGRYPDVATPGEIKEVMIDKAPDLTRLIDKLTKLALVERYTCKENRRNVNIKITNEGISLLNNVLKDMRPFEKKLESKISSDEAALLSSLLDKLRE